MQPDKLRLQAGHSGLSYLDFLKRKIELDRQAIGLKIKEISQLSQEVWKISHFTREKDNAETE